RGRRLGRNGRRSLGWRAEFLIALLEQLLFRSQFKLCVFVLTEPYSRESALLFTLYSQLGWGKRGHGNDGNSQNYAAIGSRNVAERGAPVVATCGVVRISLHVDPNGQR